MPRDAEALVTRNAVQIEVAGRGLAHDRRRMRFAASKQASASLYCNPAAARRRASKRTASRHAPITVSDNTVVIVPSA